MGSIVSATRDTAPTTQSNCGLAGKNFEDVRNTGAKAVMKSNVAKCIPPFPGRKDVLLLIFPTLLIQAVGQLMLLNRTGDWGAFDVSLLLRNAS